MLRRMDDNKQTSSYEITLPSSTKELCAFYEDTAKTYDSDYLDGFGYGAPKVTADTVAQYVKSKDASILDLASGTGLVGDQLKVCGFTNVHAVDMSPTSLTISEEKGTYKSYLCAEIGPSPMNIEPDTYDALVCCGSFVPSHLDQSCFPEIIRVVKPGGFIIISMREEWLQKAEEFKDDKFENAIQDLVEERKWKLAERKKYPNHLHNAAGVTFVLQIL